MSRGHKITVYEPENSWSYGNLVAEEGEHFLAEFAAAYPNLSSIRYRSLELDHVLKDAQLAIVHEWNSPSRPPVTAQKGAGSDGTPSFSNSRPRRRLGMSNPY